MSDVKKSTYKILTKLPVYGTFLKYSKNGEVTLCSPLFSNRSEEEINVTDVFKLLEEKYPGEVVTNQIFAEEYRKIKNLSMQGNKYSEDLERWDTNQN